MCVMWIIYVCDVLYVHVYDVTHTSVWRGHYICVTFLSICVTWLVRMCEVDHVCHVVHVHVYHVILLCVLVHVCDVVHARLRCASYMCVVCLIHMCVVIESDLMGVVTPLGL